MIKVLNLVTTERPFFESQVEILEKKGVEQTTISVPGKYIPQEGITRSVLDYIRFYPEVLYKSFADYDLIHANNGLVAPHSIMQPNLPVVISFWGLDVVSSAYYQDRVSQICSQYADETIVMSKNMQENLGVDSHIIPHGVDLTKFYPSDQFSAQRKVSWDPNQKHVLFPYAPSREEKNHHMAKEIVANANERTDENIKLHEVYGVPHDEIPTYLNACDALLLTSHTEGSPNSVKEALACNIPIISTDVGDVRYLLNNVEDCCVSNEQKVLETNLIKVLNSGDRTDGRRMAENLSLDSMGDQIIQVYQSAMSE